MIFNRLGKLKNRWRDPSNLNFTNIVIVNNGSTDGTQAWLRQRWYTSHCINPPRIRCVGRGFNSGGDQCICEQLASDWVITWWWCLPRQTRWSPFSWISRDVGYLVDLVKDPQGNLVSDEYAVRVYQPPLATLYVIYTLEFIPEANRSCSYKQFILLG